MFRILRRIPKLKKNNIRVISPFKTQFNESFTSSTLIATSFASAAVFPYLNKKQKLTPDEEARNIVCAGLKRNGHSDELRDLSSEQIPDALVNAYIKYPHKHDFLIYYNEQLKKLVEHHKIPIDEALELLVKYNQEQHSALKTLHPSEIADLNSFELFALLETKKYGVNADDIRNTNSIGCWYASKVFIKLVEDRHLLPKDALSEVQGLVISKETPNDSVTTLILTAIYKKYRRNDVMLLLNGKSIEEVESNPKLKALFKIKMNFILEQGYSKSLFQLLASLEEFTKLQQEVLQELNWHSHLPYHKALSVLTSLTEDELLQLNTRQYRRLAHEKIKTAALTEKDVWFNTYHHVHALDALVNKQMLTATDAVAALKSIQELKQLECIAKGATLAQSAEMNFEQQSCFLELNDFQFAYGLSAEYRLTGMLALTIKPSIPHDQNYLIATYLPASLKKLVSGKIPVSDSIQIINLMDTSAHRGLDEYLKNMTHYLKPRYHHFERQYISRKDVKSDWTEDTRDIFHPGDIISALSRHRNHQYDFSNSNNPYAVSELAFHVMGLGRDFFKNLNEENPILNIETMRKFNQVDQYLREQFPEIAEFADSMKKLHVMNSVEKRGLLQLIEEKFGKEIIIQPGFMKKEEEQLSFLTLKR